jgi:LacI family transcriptional regulator
MGNPRLKDVAKAANVSVATASLVLNGKKNFSVKVRNRVYDAAQRLEYIKPVYAPSVATKHIHHLALLVPEDDEKAFTWHFIRQVIIHLEAALASALYSPVILPIHSTQPADVVLEKVIASKVRGLFSLLCGTPGLFQQLERGGIPVVVMADSNFQDRCHTVCIDEFQGAYEATRHLLSLGHRRIAYVEYQCAAQAAVVHDRFIGFKKALAEEQLPFPDHYRLCADLLHLATFQADLHAMFSQPDAPTALYIQDDYLAAQIVCALQQVGRRVPEDVSLIATGDLLDYTQPFVPQISTMQMNAKLLGDLACDLIVRHFDQKPAEVQVVKINPQLVERGSCQPINAAL